MNVDLIRQMLNAQYQSYMVAKQGASLVLSSDGYPLRLLKKPVISCSSLFTLRWSLPRSTLV